MFFCVGTHKYYPLTVQHRVNNFDLRLDTGWCRYNDIFYKGYTINNSLVNKVQNNEYKHSEPGNYCILDFSNGFEIHYDNCRSFPLYMGKDYITNHPAIGGQQVYFDATTKWQNNHFAYTHQSLQQNFSNKEFGFEEIVDLLCEYLVQTCQNLQTELPIFTTYTGGMDSTLINSAFDYAGIAYTEHKIENQVDVDYWAYKQLPVTGKPQLQLTGFYGDTVLMRNPVMVNTLLSVHGIDLKEHYAQSNGYTKPVYLKRYKKQMYLSSQFDNRLDANKHVHNQLVNNYEIWHYNQCLTYTPLKSHKLIDIMLQADADTLLKQCLDAELSRCAINRLNPKNSKRLRLQK